MSSEATRLALHPPVYDCVYLALGRRIRCRLVAADERFARALAPTEHGGTLAMLTDLMTAGETPRKLPPGGRRWRRRHRRRLVRKFLPIIIGDAASPAAETDADP